MSLFVQSDGFLSSFVLWIMPRHLGIRRQLLTPISITYIFNITLNKQKIKMIALKASLFD